MTLTRQECQENLTDYQSWQSAWYCWVKLYELGFNLVPAAPNTKLPVEKYKHLYSERLSQFEWERYRYVYRKQWSCNMMLVMGTYPGSPGVVCVDPDSEESEAYVQSSLPESPVGTFTRRGLHRIYRHPGEYMTTRHGQTIGGVHYKLDLKGDRSLIVAPGSRHESGHIYEWAQEWSPELIAQAPVFQPGWLPHEGPLKEHDLEGAEDFDFSGHDDWCENGNGTVSGGIS